MQFFFFQAEDGIRGGHVTGVQTCALPISLAPVPAGSWNNRSMPSDLTFDDPASDVMLDEAAQVRRSILPGGIRLVTQTDRSVRSATLGLWLPVGSRDERSEHAGSRIGRAPCREGGSGA